MEGVMKDFLTLEQVLPGIETGEHLTIIPTSVIDVGAQNARKNEDHSSVSSRQNYSPFPSEPAILCYEFYLKQKETIFDPFAGWGERGFYAKLYNKQYIGYDTSSDAVQNARDVFGIRNIVANSLTAPIPRFDGLITCPPYWNLEKYSGVDGLDAVKTYGEFLEQYSDVLFRCYSAAENGAVFCIVVGDWRKNNTYYDLEFETCRIFKSFRAVIIDKLVLSRKGVSKIKIMLPQAKRLGYSVKVHEHLLVFQKPK